MADDMLKNRVVFEIPDMEKKCDRIERIYKTVNGLDLKMVVYAPHQLPAVKRVPGIIFIHGGPFPSEIPLLPTQWGQYISLGELATAFGCVGITFHHRYHDLGMINESALDIEDAIFFARANADEIRLDPDNICLWAISGGGIFLSQIMNKCSEFIKCLVAYYARLDMRGLAEAELNPVSVSEFSPAAAMEKAAFPVRPTFIARAGLDKPDLNEGIDRFTLAALSQNVSVDLSNHENGQHAFDILDNTPRSKEIINRTFEFVQFHLNTS